MHKITDDDIDISIEFLKEHKDIILTSNGIPVAEINTAYMADLFRELKQLRAENARLRDALQFYADCKHITEEGARGNYTTTHDHGEHAIAALEKHVREIEHIDEISTPSTQAENVSKNSEERGG
jgi:hypothetical protein